MFLFSRELAVLSSAVREKRPAHVIGPAGMGATTLLGRLRSRLDVEGYTVVAIDGAPYSSRGGALSAAEAGRSRAAPPSLLSRVDSLAQELLANDLRALIVDGIENVDGGTLRIIQAAATRTETPVVYSRGVAVSALMRSDVRYCRFPGTRLRLRPLDFTTTATLVADRLAGRPDVEVVSNVLSLSSGITGLILAIVDGVRDDGLVRLHEGRWLMTGRGLWSSGVEAWVERGLARLDLTTFEAIRHLALAHDSRPWAPCPLVAHEMLKDLEARGFLSVVDGPDGLGIRLLPPAMADYFRFTVGRDSALESCPCGGSAPAGLRADDHTASLVRSTRGRSTRTRDERAAEWAAAPSAATALPYLEALLETPRGAGDVERVFAGTPIASAATPEDALDLVLLRASAEGSLTRPVPERLDELTQLFPALRPALDLFARVLTEGSSAVDASPATMTMLRSLGVSAESLCVAALAYVALLEGDVREAAYWEGRVPACPLLAVERLVGAVRALVPLARGDFGLALAGSMRSLEIARAEEELTGVLLNSYYAALALLALGRWTEALDVADTALAYGPPGPAHTGFYRALLWLASLVNHWLGENRLATLLEAQASTLVVTDDALPAMQGDVGSILRSLIGGEKAAAMSELRRLAACLAGERNLLTAIFTLVVGLCIWPEPPTFAQLGELASNALGVPRWPLVDLVRASFEEPDQLASLAETIGRTPHSALAALVLAARVRQECGQRSELAEAIGAALLVLVRDEPLPGLRDPEDDAGQRQRTESLTPRETQVALLAATLPNTAVASMLGIGVRTIENHIHSALKKTGARNRQELFARLRGTS